MALDVFTPKTRSLGGETVRPAEDGKFLPEGARGTGEPLGRVVRARIAHEAYLEVQCRNGGYEICEAGGELETPADTAGEARPQSVMGDEKHAPLDLPTRNGLGDVVQEPHDAETHSSFFAHSSPDPALRKLLLHPPNRFEDVLENVEMMVGPLFLAPGKPELRYLAEKRFGVERGRKRLV
jgi:hypothetical protein